MREQLDEATSDITSDVLLLGVGPVVFLALLLGQGHVTGTARMVETSWLYLGATAILIGLVIRKMLKSGETIDNLRAGYDAELAVGQELDQLMLRGARVFHDSPAENFSIDHIVVSPQGDFAVETKGYTKPGDLMGREGATVVLDDQTLRFPKWTTTEPLEQATKQAKWLSKWMVSAVGKPVVVTPVLALPGWFVDDRRQARSELGVFRGRALGRMLDKPRDQLGTQDLQQVAYQVEQRCRTVLPTYRKDLQKGR